MQTKRPSGCILLKALRRCNEKNKYSSTRGTGGTNTKGLLPIGSNSHQKGNCIGLWIFMTHQELLGAPRAFKQKMTPTNQAMFMYMIYLYNLYAHLHKNHPPRWVCLKTFGWLPSSNQTWQCKVPYTWWPTRMVQTPASIFIAVLRPLCRKKAAICFVKPGKHGKQWWWFTHW